MDLQTYVKPELLILVPVLYTVGLLIKQTEMIKDKYIPVTLGAIGVVLSMLYVIAVSGFSGIGVFTGLTQGILVTGVAVYVNQLFKQSGEDE